MPVRDRQPTRIFLGPVETAGYFAHLRRGFVEMGLRTTLLDLSRHRFAYGGDDRILWGSILARAVRGRWQTPRSNLPLRLVWFVTSHLARFALFVHMLLAHDVFIFGAQSFYASRRDLAVLRWLGKRTIFVFLGSDSRPPYLNGRRVAEGPIDAARLIAETRRIKRRLRRTERWADLVVSNTYSAQLHERPFLPFSAAGFPTVEWADADGSGPSAAPPVVVLHAPSHAAGKGTARIGEVVARLVARGYAIDYRELQGRPNAEVHRALEECDFVIDQLYSDAPMAGFAREAAVHGKPAVVGTYAAADFERDAAKGLLPPCRWTTPERLEEAVADLASNPALRRCLGDRARRFVTSSWSASAVARRLLDGLDAAEGLVDPRSIRYTGGYGLSAARRREVVSAVLRAGGEESLMVDDKPALKRRLLDEVVVNAPEGTRVEPDRTLAAAA